MRVGSPAKRPIIFPFVRAYRHVIDARDAPSHEAVLVKLPVLVSIGPEPVARVVMPLVGKAYSNAVGPICPEFFDQAIVQFTIPLSRKELHDRFAPNKELG